MTSREPPLSSSCSYENNRVGEVPRRQTGADMNTHRFFRPARAAFAVATILASTLAMVAAGPALATDGGSSPGPAPGTPPFGVGERMVFSIDYGPVNAGEGVLEIAGLVEAAGDTCYRVESTARSNRFFSKFYRVRDKVVSYVDRDQLFSRYFMKRLREGTYEKTVEIEFDHAAGKAVYHDGREFDVPAGVHDVLSAFYFVRTLDLAVGKDVFFSAHSSRKTYDMRVIVHRQEAVETDLGTFDCFVIQPVMEGEGLFKHEGDLMIYLTADARRIPVLMRTKLPVGSIDANLREYVPATGAAGE